MINDQVKVLGELNVVLTDKDGNVKTQFHTPNLVVSVGKDVIASRLTGVATAVMSHMAIGSTNTAPSTANTTLATELGRVALTTSGGIAVANVVTFAAVFGPGVGTGAVVEAGIFNAGTAGAMLSRTIFSVVNKDALDTLSITWTLSIN